MKTKNLASFGVLLTFSLLFALNSTQAQVKIGTNPGVVNGNSVLELESSGKGVLLPRSTTGQISGMTSVPTGMIIFNTTDSTVYLKRDTGWVVLAVTARGGDPTLFASSSSVADFYALMPTDNPAAIPSGSPINFPQSTITFGSILRETNSRFNLLKSGAYHVSYTVSVNEPAQLAFYVNGILVPSTVSGRSAANTQLAATTILSITAGSTLELRNVSNTAITLSPNAGGINPVSAHLSIIKIL